jgi:hypothetical protein
MRRLTVLLAIIGLLLLAAAPGALARGSVTVKGHPVEAKKLSSAITLPNGQRSTVTFTLRKAGGARVTGYAVASTRYYCSFDLNPYTRCPRSAAFSAFRSAYTVGARFVYRRLSGSGRTYKVLGRVYCKVIAE